MVNSHPDLKKLFGKKGNTLYLKKDIATKIIPLSRDAGKTFDGANIQMGVLDELAAHPNTDILDVVKSSQGARENPMMLYISTAGFDLSSPMYLEVEHSKKILEGQIQDENYFCFIAKKDKDTDPYSDEAILQTNPNVGVSVSMDYLQKERDEAKTRSEKKVNYLTKHINEFVNSSEEVLSKDQWDYCKTEHVPDLSTAVRCSIGLDLSVSDDFTSICSLWLFPDNTIYAKWLHIIPSDDLQQRQRALRVPLHSWIEQGFIRTSQGASINLDYVTDILYEYIEEGVSLGVPTELIYDPYKAKSVIAKLENDKGFMDHKHCYQGFATITEPLSRFMGIVKDQQLSVPDDPVIDWMVSNMVLIYDNFGNMKFDKSDRYKKVDGISALVSAIYGIIPYLDENQNTEVIWI